jgi:hypothetical protein
MMIISRCISDPVLRGRDEGANRLIGKDCGVEATVPTGPRACSFRARSSEH